MSRDVPADILGKTVAWRKFQVMWNPIHYITGFGSAVLSSIIAANVKAQFLNTTTAVIIAAVAAGLTALVTAMGAHTKGKAYEIAARELEATSSLYEHDLAIPEAELGKAVKRATEVLNGTK
jgi:hypothetical protein